MNGSLCKLANAIELERGDRSAYRLGHTFGRNKSGGARRNAFRIQCVRRTRVMVTPLLKTPVDLSRNRREPTMLCTRMGNFVGAEDAFPHSEK